MTDHLKSPNQDQGGGGFAGTLRNIQLTDIIQMCCLAGTSICVRVRQDQNQGNIYIQDGDIVHAQCGAISGTKAFLTILGWPSGQFETLDASASSPRTIKEPYQFLLMEAARMADEQAQTRREAPVAPEAEASRKLRVLIVDDSAIMSKILNSMLSADPGIEVIGSAKNGEEALSKMKELSPDLITMDVNMPVMDGSTALKHIMIESPCPVLIMSNLGPSSYATILSFLNLGAVDFMSKPVKNRNIVQQQQRMVDRVQLAVTANIKRFQRVRPPKLTADDYIKVNEKKPCEKLMIAISGVGGHLEMVNLITSLPNKPSACLLSLQSIPPPFAPTLSEYLNVRSRFDVMPFQAGARLCAGRCYIGTSERAIDIDLDEAVWVFKDADPTPHADGSTNFDRLLGAVSELYLDRVVIVLLSGCEIGTMQGLEKVKENGGQIVAPQLEKCILPTTITPVVEKGLVTEIFSPKEIGQMLTRYCS